jgi:hypothetical protein
MLPIAFRNGYLVFYDVLYARCVLEEKWLLCNWCAILPIKVPVVDFYGYGSATVYC